ncbi:MAG TPA: glycosyltransferase family 1 protein [Ignavibacteriaceae bacterium]|nr:glycosyltransferase family 1 protein [Ignavibacteriaceae bacterium]
MRFDLVKVLFDHQCFVQQQYGGVSRYHYQLIKELNKLKDVKSILSLKYSNNFYINEDKSFEVKKFFPNHKFYFKRTILDYINRLSTIPNLKKGDYDIFHPTYFGTYFLKHLNAKPFIVTVYDSIHEKYPEIINSIDRTLEYKKEIISKANLILAISNSAKNDLINIYKIPAEKIKVVYLAASINKNFALSKEQLSLPEKYILFVGNRDFYKNFKNFIQAIAPLLKEQKDLFLISAGGGGFSNDEIKYFRSMQIENKVIYKNADDASLATLYSNALAFIFPSLYEGFGIPALEAMNCDCPVIMSNTSSLPEVGGDAAIYFEPNDIEDIKNKIAKVIFDKELRKELIEKGKIQRSKFSFEKTAKETLEVYEKLAAVR